MTTYWNEEVEKNSTLKPVGDAPLVKLNGGHHCWESRLPTPAGLTGNDWPETSGRELTPAGVPRQIPTVGLSEASWPLMMKPVGAGESGIGKKVA